MRTNRRTFLKHTAAAGAALGFPLIIPARVLGAEAPGRQLQVGLIGCGRIARDMEIPSILKHSNLARLVAVCDLDAHRLASAVTLVEGLYAKKLGGDRPVRVKPFADFRELVADPALDAVMITTPDHWHALPVIVAALAGKDIWVQKPCSLTIAEGRAVREVVRAKQRIFQIGSQQRSSSQFRRACELVRSGRIGKLRTIRVGLPTDPSGGRTVEMPVPAQLNYNAWLGSTPMVPYTEDRVHPQKGFDRPGWLRCEQFGAGMITGWGSHHLDIAHWAMDTERTGPVAIEGRATFPAPGSGLWDVHGAYDVTLTYASGVKMQVSDTFPNGVRFEGEDGWIFVSRGAQKVTASDPSTPGVELKALDASRPEILADRPGAGEVRLPVSHDHMLNWLEAVRARKDPIAPVDVAHRSCSACLLAHIGMKLQRKLQWDPSREEFVGDDEANRMRSRPERAEYSVEREVQKAGFTYQA